MTDSRLNLCSTEGETRFVIKIAEMTDSELLKKADHIKDHPMPSLKRALNFIHLELMDRGYKKVERWEKIS